MDNNAKKIHAVKLTFPPLDQEQISRGSHVEVTKNITAENANSIVFDRMFVSCNTPGNWELLLDSSVLHRFNVGLGQQEIPMGRRIIRQFFYGSNGFSFKVIPMDERRDFFSGHITIEFHYE